MKIPKQLGIWMDHSMAHLMEITNDTIAYSTILSAPVQEEKQNFGNDESQKHNKEQNKLSGFYKRLSDVIKDFQEVILFGPTGAKTELFNLLRHNIHFENIKIEVKTTDNLTENQMQAYVKEHFASSV